ncbi:MAG: hypothetical protein AAGC64_13420 [Bacteroidota bacterium]
MTLLENIKQTQQELERYVSQYFSGEYNWPESDVKRVLGLLEKEINKEKQNPRVFAAYRDITVVSIRNYENIPLGKSISALSKQLDVENDIYANTGVLGADFGKQDPV